jgi:GTP-binding protein
VFLLIDSRHGLKDSDTEVMELLDEAAVNYQLVLTKSDKIKAAELEKVLAESQKATARHGAAHPEVLATSAEKGIGMDELRKAISSLL